MLSSLGPSSLSLPLVKPPAQPEFAHRSAAAPNIAEGTVRCSRAHARSSPL